MSFPRIITSVIALVLMVVAGYFLSGSQQYWTGGVTYLFYVLLAIYFFALLVSNQRFEEDIMAKTERVTGSILFSYVVFTQLVYAPLARYIFSTLIQQKFFLSDVLALLMFLLFLFLFGTCAMVLTSFSRFGFLSGWSLFNNLSAYYILRSLWPTAVLITIFLFLLAPFLIINV